MRIQRVAPSLSKGIKYYTTSYLWCSDGWTYDVTAMVRRKYESIEPGIFEMTEEPVTKGVFSDVQYVEKLEITMISESPRIWIERGTDISDMFQEVTTFQLSDTP